MVSNGGIIGLGSQISSTTTPAGNQIVKTSSGNVTISAGVSTADVLVVGGGGGGGSYAGGAGAGGLCYQPGRSVSPGTIAVTIGAGGAGGGNHAEGLLGEVTRGEDTEFDTGGTTINAEGGGFAFDDWCSDGGSGGGSGDTGHNSNDFAPGMDGYPDETSLSATQGDSGGATGFGNDGAPGNRWGGTNHGSGGGGAGAAGSQSTSSPAEGGAGGAGKDYSSVFGSSVGESGWFAGGGGGGRTGHGPPVTAEGGGGNWELATAEANTGGGGSGSAGGSGVVIVKEGAATVKTASGMWTLKDVFDAEKADTWPT